MSAAAVPSSGPARADRIAELQQQVHRMQGTAAAQPVPTLPALRPLLQLRTGTSCTVDSPALAMALMAGPSSAGWWSAVVGLPELGLEAAASFGVALDRTVLVPDPGASWLTVVATLVDVLPVVVLRPPGQVGQHQAARLSARLRQRGAVLLVVGDWPRAEARLQVVDSRWTGIGSGHGHLAGRSVTVQAQVGVARRRAELWLPDASAGLRPPECDASAGEPRTPGPPAEPGPPGLTLVETAG